MFIGAHRSGEWRHRCPTGHTGYGRDCAVALGNGFAVLCGSDADMVAVVNEIAPEHLELIGERAERLAPLMALWRPLHR